jgi:phenylpropionate dioxygenase-like ring-hydroxylating dioxygenase large terminal subunit
MPEVAPGPTRVHGPPPVEPRPITAERYVSAAWMVGEADRVWPRSWLFACLERDVADPGAYVVFNLGRESIIVSGTSGGEVVAHYNACQHRGARVLTDQRGCERSFTCPYHGWSYRPDGRLVVVPDNHRFPDGGVDRSERSLKPVRVGVRLGMVWVCMEDGVPSLDEFLGPVFQRVAPYRLEQMTLIDDQTVELDCNWKAVFDNFGELYHVEHIHPQHQRMFNCPTAATDLFEHGHTGVVIDGHTVNTRLPIPEEPTPYLKMQVGKFGGDPAVYRGRVLEIREDLQKMRRETGPKLGWDYGELSDQRLSDVEQYNLFPNTMITVQPDDAIVMRAMPHLTDPNRCTWDKFTFHRHPSAEVAERAGVEFEPFDVRDVPRAERPEHDHFTQQDVIAGHKSMTATIDQDIHLIRDVQAGMHSRGFVDQLLCVDEVRVQHYHDWMDHVMGVR